MNLSHNESLKIIRKSARKVGLVFKKSNVRLNGACLYKLCDRKTGEMVLTNYLFSSAFNDACSGYIESWNGQKFMGVDSYI